MVGKRKGGGGSAVTSGCSNFGANQRDVKSRIEANQMQKGARISGEIIRVHVDPSQVKYPRTAERV